VSKSDTKQQSAVTLSLLPGKASEYQKKLWSSFWLKIGAQSREQAVQSDIDQEHKK
jgi:hypothetical protein